MQTPKYLYLSIPGDSAIAGEVTLLAQGENVQHGIEEHEKQLNWALLVDA